MNDVENGRLVRPKLGANPREAKDTDQDFFKWHRTITGRRTWILLHLQQDGRTEVCLYDREEDVLEARREAVRKFRGRFAINPAVSDDDAGAQWFTLTGGREHFLVTSSEIYRMDDRWKGPRT